MLINFRKTNFLDLPAHQAGPTEGQPICNPKGVLMFRATNGQVVYIYSSENYCSIGPKEFQASEHITLKPVKRIIVEYED